MRVAIACAAAALVLSSFGAEAKGRFRGFSSSKPATGPAKPEKGGASFFVAPALGGVGVAAAAAATGSVAPAAGPTMPVERVAPKPRDPCAADKLFGAGAGFCAVN